MVYVLYRRLGSADFFSRLLARGSGAIRDVARLLLLHHRGGAGHGLVHLDDEVAQHRVVELEGSLELDEGLVGHLDVHQHVVRLEHLGDRVGELRRPQSSMRCTLPLPAVIVLRYRSIMPGTCSDWSGCTMKTIS